MKMPSVETLQWMATVMARNLRCFANEAREYDITEEEEQNLRDIADRLDAGTATDTDWEEAISYLDING